MRMIQQRGPERVGNLLRIAWQHEAVMDYSVEFIIGMPTPKGGTT